MWTRPTPWAILQPSSPGSARAFSKPGCTTEIGASQPRLEFVRVAVLSPETSAGLGDFRREADRLQIARLCEFHLFSATFQGVDAPHRSRTLSSER